jgi:hypothetical protein
MDSYRVNELLEEAQEGEYRQVGGWIARASQVFRGSRHRRSASILSAGGTVAAELILQSARPTDLLLRVVVGQAGPGRGGFPRADVGG